ncbi:MAG: hypothetical protein AB8B64_10615 [Granulosicoccus sp.]
MAKNPSDNVKLYGTDEPVVPMRTLFAGPVSCEFDQGALRFIKVYGKEAIRNIAFVVRDKDWGTYLPALSNIQIDQSEDAFQVSFDAICKDDQQEIHYKASITGTADGSLSFTGKYTAITDFLTNRTGFVVLHPVTGVAGQPVTVEHVNGDVDQSEFPELVDPVQPFKNIRALTHNVLPGVRVCCRMTGDTFEMEDHRQWNDASYKTYVRPISLPWPFTIPRSESIQQSVSLTISTSAEHIPEDKGAQDAHPCIITVNDSVGTQRMPDIGLGLEPQHLQGAIAHQNLLKELSPQQLVVWHELDKHDSNHLKQAAELAHHIDSHIDLQAIIPDKDFKAEIAKLANQCREADVTLRTIHIAPAMYLSSIMPGTSWPKVTPLAEIYDETRIYFPEAAVGGGMLSFFPELNRHRPPTEHVDFIGHASNTITHASDDITVTENLEAIPHIIKTCRSFAGHKPYHVGPSSIGMRFNPYGSKTMDNPDNTRIAMARMDPRQRGLINAAWTVGYVAHMARGGIDCVNLHAPTGEFGIVNHQEDWKRPGFDDTARQVYPVYHVMAGLTKAASKAQMSIHSSMGREVEAVGYQNGETWIVWIANLTCDSRCAEIKGLNLTNGKVATLSLDTFDHCTQFCDGFEQTTKAVGLPTLTLGPYSVVRLTTSAN